MFVDFETGFYDKLGQLKQQSVRHPHQLDQ